ncbi:KANSL2 [Bugula neritina]|uniref:KAT8 regulatory NSL complex subunit 2 n=1 Tax=Bugula neritina TaxID=10212 RepID=A0A7J7JIU9_BUGNE|nr:KANSL2 [Bugula neritina]
MDMDMQSSGQMQCRYSLRQCHKSVLDGYQYCYTHILEDKGCPFYQCSYVSGKTGRRCAQATLKPGKKDGLCPQHSLKLNRSRCMMAKKQLASNVDIPESLLGELEYHSTTLYNNSRGKQKVPSGDNSNSHLAELASSSDSEVERSSHTVASMWQPDSDSESVDSEQEDMFKYAEVLTAEEVTRITRDKLIRLQSLYIEQFKWLQNVLRERRRKYLQSRTVESPTSQKDYDNAAETANPIMPVKDDSFSNTNAVTEYIALRRYHRRHGQEALMYMRSQERRRAVCDPSATDGHNTNKYRYSSKHGTKYCSVKSSKCHAKSLPFTRYCIKHVERDVQQVLFRRCGYQAVEDGLNCERIVPNISSYNRCDYHCNVGDFELMYAQCERSASEEIELHNSPIISSPSHPPCETDAFIQTESTTVIDVGNSAPPNPPPSHTDGDIQEPKP